METQLHIVPQKSVHSLRKIRPESDYNQLDLFNWLDLGSWEFLLRRIF